MDEPIRILVADDHPGFRSGLRALLGAQVGLTLVGEAETGTDVVELAATLQPDVILMDLSMPGLDGIAATRRIVDTSPHIAVLVLTMADDDAAVFDALRAGARGYLLKGADRLELARAIRAVAAGEAIFGPNVARRLMAYFAGAPIAPIPAFPELSDREREVLELIARGMSNQQIVDRLVISPKTVRNHVSNIFSKMQVRDRAEAVVRAREAGLGGERRSS
ncbi:MAG TPA: response regulator transcription factor [Candidatus Limnocylindrales bacterium]|nr:response regulator transcription factor [Candidatus Limnocylindrales bacterium]